MPGCWHCKAETTDDHYDRIVYNKQLLYAEWNGWRMAGRFLIGPHGERFTPDRLAAIAWNDRKQKRVSSGTVTVVEFPRSGKSHDN
ncbi:MAG: DUF3653 domain-containing protein [Cypionkella sp.]